MPFARREVAGSNPVAPIFQESVCTGSFIFHYLVHEKISLPEYPNPARNSSVRSAPLWKHFSNCAALFPYLLLM